MCCIDSHVARHVTLSLEAYVSRTRWRGFQSTGNLAAMQWTLMEMGNLSGSSNHHCVQPSILVGGNASWSLADSSCMIPPVHQDRRTVEECRCGDFCTSRCIQAHRGFPHDEHSAPIACSGTPYSPEIGKWSEKAWRTEAVVSPALRLLRGLFSQAGCGSWGWWPSLSRTGSPSILAVVRTAPG